MGQTLDMIMEKSFKDTKKLDKFTMDRYKAIVKHKTAYYSFPLPIALAMHVVSILYAVKGARNSFDRIKYSVCTTPKFISQERFIQNREKTLAYLFMYLYVLRDS